MKIATLILTLVILGCDSAKDPVAPTYPTPTPLAVVTPTRTPAPEHLVTATFRDSQTGALVNGVVLRGTRNYTLPTAWWTVYAPDGTGTWFLPAGEWLWRAEAPGYKDLNFGMYVGVGSTDFVYRMEVAR